MSCLNVGCSWAFVVHNNTKKNVNYKLWIIELNFFFLTLNVGNRLWQISILNRLFHVDFESLHTLSPTLTLTICLKGQCYEIFDSLFFHQSTSYRSLIIGFAYGFVFAEVIASKVVKIAFSGVNDPLKPKIKYRIPHLFCLKYRYGTEIFTYEIVLLDIPFKKMMQTRNEDLKFRQSQ
jgi:hypothetical protein